jgi:sec-independent protein translocase protein TatC
MSTIASELRGIGVRIPERDTTDRQTRSFWRALALTGAVLSDMSFLDHLEELRRRLIKSVIAVAAGLLLSTAYAPAIIRFLKAPAAEYGIEIVGYGALEMFTLYFHVALASGICLASPVVLFQAWRFIEPALYPHEKRYALPFLISTTLFFLLGAAFGYMVATPYIMRMQLELAALMEIVWRPSAVEYISLLTATVIAMGAVFEMPPVIFILSRIGLVDARFLLRNFKYAFLILTVLSGVLTPSGDLGPMVAFLAVMLALYLLSILVALAFSRKRKVV